MFEGRFKPVLFLVAVFFLVWTNASPQQIQPRPQQSARNAEGTLSVTVTVVPSTGVVIGPDGQQQIIVANAADPSDGVSNWPKDPVVKVVALSPVVEQKSGAKPAHVRGSKTPNDSH